MWIERPASDHVSSLFGKGNVQGQEYPGCQGAIGRAGGMAMGSLKGSSGKILIRKEDIG